MSSPALTVFYNIVFNTLTLWYNIYMRSPALTVFYNIVFNTLTLGIIYT